MTRLCREKWEERTLTLKYPISMEFHVLCNKFLCYIVFVILRRASFFAQQKWPVINSGGEGHDKIWNKISDLKITNIFGYLPRKKVLLWTDWIPNFPMTRSDHWVPFRTHPKRYSFSATEKKPQFHPSEWAAPSQWQPIGQGPSSELAAPS